MLFLVVLLVICVVYFFNRSIIGTIPFWGWLLIFIIGALIVLSVFLFEQLQQLKRSTTAISQTAAAPQASSQTVAALTTAGQPSPAQSLDCLRLWLTFVLALLVIVAIVILVFIFVTGEATDQPLISLAIAAIGVIGAIVGSVAGHVQGATGKEQAEDRADARIKEVQQQVVDAYKHAAVVHQQVVDAKDQVITNLKSQIKN